MSMKLFRFNLLTVFAAAALFASAAFAHQNGPARGSHIFVAKAGSNLGEYTAHYTSIQEAVNNAQPDQVIEILDEADYLEQVTIDGRADRRWPAAGTGQPAPVGGKNNITIKYVPPAGAAVSARPTIKWQDTRNTSPTTCAQAKTPGDSIGASGNFETNGALRIIRASGIVIEGLIIDGGGSHTFSNKPVWVDGPCANSGSQQYTAIQHGNSAVALAVSRNVQIRDCQLKNAYFGMYVKDRNTGGIFGNPNPADNDVTIPLSGFGQTGNHLIEYNRIGGNDVGLFFESCWDLGSTVRYNLIYNNYHRAAVSGVGEDSDKSAAAIIFKDIYITPLAIYNNTFYNNAAHFIGMWQVGYQHLIFNNILVPRRGTGGQEQNDYNNGGTNSYMAIEHLFPQRMHHCVFAKDAGGNDNDVQFRRLGQLQNAQPGASLLGGQGEAPAIPAAANVRWLETPFSNVTETAANFLEPNWSGTGVGTYIKDYGWPDAGILDADGSRADLGAISSDVTSKRPCDGKPQTSRARVTPYGFVTITMTGTGQTATGTAITKVTVSQEVGELKNIKVKYLRWITPVPDNADPPGGEDLFGNKAHIVLAGSIRTVTPAATATWDVGNNQVNITVTGVPGTYGFFELILEGTDLEGKTVTTDVGFLPYRQLDYWLDIKLSGPNVTTPPGGIPTVRAGQPVTMTVTAMNRATGAKYAPTSGGTNPLNVAYSLSEITSNIFRTVTPEPGNPLVEDNIYTATGGYSKEYTNTIYFTKANASEVITGSGLWCNGDCSNATTPRLVFPGDLAVNVRPGEPAKVVFQDPIPKSQLGDKTPATVIDDYPVTVQVQDRFNNPVDTDVPVTLKSLHPAIGDVVPPVSATTSTTTGNAEFTATRTGGNVGDIFDLEASATAAAGGGAIKPDTGSLRIGRASDGLRVFYFQSTPPKHGSEAGGKGGYWEDDFSQVTGIDEQVKTWVPIWVKVRSNAGDTIITTKNGEWICVKAEQHPSIQFSTDSAGTASVGPFEVVNGVTKFWITSAEAVSNAVLTVSARTSADCAAAEDRAITGTTRGRITFNKPTGGVGDAFVKGDGNARPTEIEITFTGDGNGDFSPGSWNRPDSINLKWPCVDGPGVTAKGTDITVLPDNVTIRAVFPANTAFPVGYSEVSGSDVITIYNAIDPGSELSPGTLNDSIGPLIANYVDAPLCGVTSVAGPTFDENKTPGTTPDVLRFRTTEPLKDPQALVGSSLLISSDAAGTGERPVIVESVSFVGGTYTLTLSTTSQLTDGYWIKFDPGKAGLTDGAGNSPHANNRRVQIKEQEAPASVAAAWYTTVDATGRADAIYITFDKGLTAADIQAWFAGGEFTFRWFNKTEVTFKVNADNVSNITIYPDVPNTIRIDLAKALDNGSFNAMTENEIRTSGTISLGVKFSPGKSWPEPSSVPAAKDKARPVLISAELRIGSLDDLNQELPDTLILVFSEGLKDNIKSMSEPVSILSKNGQGTWRNVKVKTDVPVDVNSSGEYVVVRYVVEEIKTSEGEPQEGDYVMINVTAGVEDYEANVQDRSDNHRVPLKIIPGKPNWKTVVRNNPFRDSIVVETTPRAKGEDYKVTARIMLYDNMGNVVVDTVAENKSGNSADPNAVRWVWYGRNRKGRYVGTGTYLFKAEYRVITENAGVKPQIVNKSIGFVRGKGK